LRERREAQHQNETLQQDLQALRLKAEQERVAQENYVRGVEDRAHREVDRAREEGKAISAQLKESGRHVEQLQRRLESIQTELSQTQQHAAAQHARADTLEQHLTRIRQAPATKRKPGSENRRRRPISDRNGRTSLEMQC
jgi:chromosome segregation ATPase